MNQIFTSIEPLGEGAFGVVSKVEHRYTNKRYAVKKLRNENNELTDEEKYSEISYYERIGDHPNVVQYIMAWEQWDDLKEWDEVYLLLELCQMSLGSFVLSGCKLPERFFWDCLYDMCQAIVHLNSKQVLHRDISSGNILLQGTCFKLGDFDLMSDLTLKGSNLRALVYEASDHAVELRPFT
uniref:non-specific serine/threonine protein kinase n=1 Tax=Diabrotica virgifera virgifera TaxID=50390 RepID=A0A6P7GSX5_DIAVI